MKKLIVKSLYFLGDLTYKSYFFRYEWGYRLYRNLMVTSSNLQDKWNLQEPWITTDGRS